ncbi:MAG: F0F1 ATP synthase subunit delta [Candidatus Saccharimonas sp.]|nr:F0F1 ATP synthase subunit delta [Candidatus Saccharimonas sp.]
MSNTTPDTFVLPSSIASPQDLTSVILEIKQYASWYNNELIKQRARVNKPADQPELSPAAVDILRLYATNHTIDKSGLGSLITLLESLSSSSPVITITLAAPATPSIKATLTTWCRQNIATNILVSFRFNSTLLGGMVVRHGSRIFDWSFRTQLMKNAPKIPEILSRV